MNAGRIVCRLCLVADVQLFNLNDNNLEGLRNCYYNLVSVKCLGLYPYICYECLALLKKFRKFWSKCLQAEQIVRNLKENVVINIDREQMGLASTLNFTNCETIAVHAEDHENNIIKVERDDDGAKWILHGAVRQANHADQETDIRAGTNKIMAIDCGNICIDEQTKADADCGKNLDGDFHKKLDVDFHKKLDLIRAETKKMITIDCGNICINEKRKIYADYAKNEDEDFHKKLDVDFDKNLDVDFDKELDVDGKNELNLDVYEEPCDFNSDSDESVNNNIDDSIFNFEFINTDANITKEIVEDYAYSLKRKRLFNYLKSFATIKRLSAEEAHKAVEERKETKKNRCTLNCNICYTGYYVQSTLDNHMKKHDPHYGSYECEYCHTRFLRPPNLCMHIENKHTWKFECSACSHVCFDVYTAKNHADTHNEKAYKCDLCSIVFKSQKTLVWHKRCKHAWNLLACKFCGDVFASVNGISLHVKVVHQGETNEPNGPHCDVCDVRFATDLAFKRHFVLSDKHKDICGCGVCGEVLDKSEILKHARKYKHGFNSMRHTMWPVACRYCDHLLNDQEEYKHHMSEVHPNISGSTRNPKETVKKTSQGTVKRASKSPVRRNAQSTVKKNAQRTVKRTVNRTAKSTVQNKIKPFICELCGKQFRMLCFLKTHHQITHEGERPYKCRTCAATFRTQSQLMVHETSHASLEERTCGVCGKVMKYQHSIKKHMKRVHLGVRPHKCTLCERTFPNACEVEYHIKYTHNKVPWPKPKRNRIRKKQDTQDS